MNHDITHCNNESCKDKEKYYRYLAYLDLKENRIKGAYSMYLADEVTNKEECKIPWMSK